MSKTFFARLSIVVFMVLIICAHRCRRGCDRLGKSIAAFLYAGAFALGCYSVVFYTEEYRILSLGYSLFFLAMDWVCFTMMKYAIEYTRYKGKKLNALDKRIPYIVIAVLAVDSVSMFCNVFFEHATRYNVVYYHGERYLRYAQHRYILFICFCVI